MIVFSGLISLTPGLTEDSWSLPSSVCNLFQYSMPRSHRKTALHTNEGMEDK